MSYGVFTQNQVDVKYWLYDSGAFFLFFFVFDDWHFHIDSRIPLDIEQYVMIDDDDIGDVNERHSATTEVMTA